MRAIAAAMALAMACNPRSDAGYERCPGGECVCAAGFANCDGLVDNACETDLGTSNEHCGACGQSCANGRCEAGVCSCEPSFGDCDLDLTNGCETSLAQDARHCGSCDHDCQGGACGGGSCQPVAVTATLADPRDLSLGGGYAIWIQGDGVHALALAGGGPQLIAMEAGAACTSYHQGRIYYLIPGAVRSVAPGELPVTVAAATGAGAARPCLVARGDHVYWIDLNAELREAPVSGGGSSLVAQQVHAIAADEQHYYWSQLDTVFQALHDGSPAAPIAFEAAAQLATHFGDIYWLASAGAIRKRTADPGPTDTVVETLSSMPSALAIDGSGIYAVLPNEGTVVRYRHQDGGMEVLASSPARSIALDEQYLYWISDTALLRVAK